MKTERVMESVTGAKAALHGIVVGRRVKDSDDGSLWVIVGMRQEGDADEYAVELVRWSPLMGRMTSDEYRSLWKSR